MPSHPHGHTGTRPCRLFKFKFPGEKQVQHFPAAGPQFALFRGGGSGGPAGGGDDESKGDGSPDVSGDLDGSLPAVYPAVPIECLRRFFIVTLEPPKDDGVSKWFGLCDSGVGERLSDMVGAGRERGGVPTRQRITLELLRFLGVDDPRPYVLQLRAIEAIATCDAVQREGHYQRFPGGAHARCRRLARSHSQGAAAAGHGNTAVMESAALRCTSWC